MRQTRGIQREFFRLHSTPTPVVNRIWRSDVSVGAPEDVWQPTQLHPKPFHPKQRKYIRCSSGLKSLHAKLTAVAARIAN
jgi:hypothetical protein